MTPLHRLLQVPEVSDQAKSRLLRQLGNIDPLSLQRDIGILDARFDEITAVYGLPEPYRKRVRTSNSIERLNEELRRRERVIQERPSH